MADGGNVADTGSSPYDTLGSKPSYIPGTVGLAAPIAALNSQQDKSDPNDTQGIQPTSSPVDWLAGEAGARVGGSLAEAAPSILGNEAGAIGSKPNMINIEHYSPEPNLTTLDPAKMGTGVDSYTPGRKTEPPFSFAYREGTQPEGLVKDRSPYKYTGQVDASKLYDLSTDPEGIASKAIQANGGAKDMSQIAQATKDAGYSGFYTSQHPNPESQNSVMMFDQVPLKPATAAPAKGNDVLRITANDYNAEKGLPPIQAPEKMVPVDPDRGARIAQAYDAMPHTPDDPQTQKAYQALIDETMDQFQGLKANGLKIDKIQPGQPNPYKSSRDLFDDVNNNNHISYFPTEQGFGSSGKDFPNNPMLQPTDEKINGEPTVANDIFRIVHDIYGHAKEGNSFGPTGEENAWLQHKQMYSPLAQKAMTTETRGQNSWVNYGPFGEANRANPGATTYADQKAGLLPDWVNNEGALTKETSDEASRQARAQNQGFDTSKTYYHGTRSPDIKSFDPNYSIHQRGAVFLSENPNFAGDYTEGAKGTNVIPVHTSVTNTFDYENPAHVKKVMQNIDRSSPGTIPSADAVKSGEWDVIENPKVQEAIKAAGFDSFRTMENYNKNLGVFDPAKIRSKFAHFDPKKKGQAGLSYAGGGGVAVGASIDPIQGGARNAYADGGSVATQQPDQQAAAPATPQDNTTNVMSPTGDLVSIPNEQLPAALHPVNGYKIATPEDVAAYQQAAKYGTPAGMLKTGANAAISSMTFGAVPGIGSNEDIRALQEENPISDIVGGVLPYAAEQFIPGAGEAADAGLLSKAGQLLTAVPHAIGLAGDAIKDASGLTGVGALALQYAAEGAIMQGNEEVSKMMLKDPDQSASSALAEEGLAAVFSGAFGAGMGGIGKVADLWEAKFGAKATDKIMDKSVPDIAEQELRSGIQVPASLRDALSGDLDASNRVQVLQKSDTIGGRATQADVHSVYEQAEDKTMEAFDAAAEMASKAPNAYEVGSRIKSRLMNHIEAGENIYGPIYDALRPRYAQIGVSPEQKDSFAQDLTTKLSGAGIGALQGSPEASTMKNLFSSLDSVSNADGVKNLLSGLNNAAKNPELSRLAAVAGPAIKDFESKVVTDYLTKISDGSAPQELARLSSRAQAAIDAGNPGEAVEAAAQVEDAMKGYGTATAMDAQKATSLLAQRKVADAAYREAMGDMTELKNAIGLGRFKGTKGFLRALDDKTPEQVLSRLGTKNNQGLTELLKKKFPEAADELRQWHVNEDMHDASLPNGQLNTKKFLNSFLDGSQNPPHMQEFMTGSPAVVPRLQAIQSLLNAVPKDGNPSNSAAMIAKLWNGKVGALMGGSMGLGGGHMMGAVLGDLGENVLKEIRPFMSYKFLQMRGSKDATNPSSVKALVDYAKSVSKGHSLVNKSVNSLFNANQVLPPSKIPSESDRNKLDKYVTQARNNPAALQNVAPDLKDVLPTHMSSIALQAQQAATYLSSIKPHAVLGLPFDSKIPPSPAQMTEYNRQLDIAQQPLMALKYMKEGSLTPNDLNTIKNVHPQMYQQLSAKIMGELTNSKSPVPYKTRMSMSLFVGQPLDSTMTPQAIISAQPLPPSARPARRCSRE